MSTERRLSEDEERLIDFLVHKANLSIPKNWKEGVLVIPLNDGGMGSLRLCSLQSEDKKRKFGKSIAEYSFKDIDGIDVMVSLNVDQDSNLFELDIWKANFMPVLSLPKHFDPS